MSLSIAHAAGARAAGCMGRSRLSSTTANGGRTLQAKLPARGSAGRTGMKVYAVDQLTGEELEVAIQSRDKPLVIDFFATWCGPCLLLANELEKVEEDLGTEVRIVKVDTDEEPDLASQLNIQGLPTMVFVGMDPNKPALRTEGLLPADTIKEIIKNEL